MINKKSIITFLSLLFFVFNYLNSNLLSDNRWIKVYGGVYDEQAISVRQTADDGYIIVGTILANNKYSAWLIKTNAFGDTIWTNKYGDNEFLSIPLVQLTADGGYMIVGSISSDSKKLVLAIKTDASGRMLWTQKYEQEKISWINHVKQTSDGGYILAGYHNEFSESRNYARLVRMDNSGKILWEKQYTANQLNNIFACQGTTDKGFILAGSTYSYVTKNKDILIIKTDSLGNTKRPDTPMIDYSYILDQNYPNPFKSTTIIQYSLPIGTPIFHQVQLKVYNISGQLVKVLVEQEQEAGMYSIGWDRTDLKGNSVSGGVYFYALEANTFRSIRKMLLIQ